MVWQFERPVSDQLEETHPYRFPKDQTLPKLIPPPPPTPKIASLAPVAPSETNTGMGSDVEQWRTLVGAYFPADQINLALAVMRCESGGNPAAYNNSFGASGLMQVLASWADNFGYTPSQLFDPSVNLHVASILFYDGGWRHWNASRHCWG